MLFRNVNKYHLASSLLVLGLLGLCLYLAVSVLAQTAVNKQDGPTPVLSLQLEGPTVRVGQPFTMHVRVDNVHHLAGFWFWLTFGTEAVRVETVELGPFLEETGRTASGIGAPDNAEGKLSFLALSTGTQAGPDGSGRLATITGQAQAVGYSEFKIQRAVLIDTEGKTYWPQLENATLEVVVAPTPTASPTVAPTSTRTPTLTPTVAPIVSKVYLPIVSKSEIGFETGTFEGWHQAGNLGQRVVSRLSNGDPPHSGQFCALLGDPEWPCENGVPVGVAAITRTVTLPDEPNLRLRFWYRLFSEDASSPDRWSEFDRFEVRINGESKRQWARANFEEDYGCDKPPYDSGWKEFFVPLDSYRGQRIEVALVNVNHPDKWYNTWTYVDDVAIKWGE